MAALADAIGAPQQGGMETNGGTFMKGATVTRPAVYEADVLPVGKLGVFSGSYKPSVMLYNRTARTPPIFNSEPDYGYQEYDYEYLGVLNPSDMPTQGFDVNKMLTGVQADTYFWTE